MHQDGSVQLVLQTTIVIMAKQLKLGFIGAEDISPRSYTRCAALDNSLFFGKIAPQDERRHV